MRISSRSTFDHISLLSEVETINKESEYSFLIRKSYNNTIKLPNNPGSFHMFAFLVASVLELLDSAEKARFSNLWLDKAITSIEYAINLTDDYAKFYCTRGRLIAEQGNYDEAIENIALAIELEDSSRTDYAMKIAEYQYYRLIVIMKKQNEKIQNDFDNYNIKINDITQEAQNTFNESVKISSEKINQYFSKNIEFVALFAGIMTFAIGSLQIVSRQDSFIDASQLIIILMGALLCLYSAFIFLLGDINKTNLIKCGFIFAIGVIIILLNGGIFFAA